MIVCIDANAITSLPEELTHDRIEEEDEENKSDTDEEDDRDDEPITLSLLLKSVLKVN